MSRVKNGAEKGLSWALLRSQNRSRSQTAINLDTCTGCHVDRPAGVRTPLASRTLAMAASVETPERRISSTTTFVVALALARLTVLAALALAAVSALPTVPSLVPRARSDQPPPISRLCL